jgi:hypothetical protein
MRTIVILSDTHCGSVFGLTPPNQFSAHHRSLQSEGWQAYQKMFRKWFRPDILIANGDLIEGTQSKQGGAELITPDRNVQAGMAVDCLREWRAKKIFLTYGTKYHVGEQAEDFEYSIAETLGATIEGRLYLRVEGMTLDVRHKVGTSGIPHGRATALMKEMMWDLIEEAKENGPKVDIVIRSHAHYHIWVEDPDKTMIITPGLQLKRGRYGTRECLGEIHWGAIRLTLHKGQIINKEKMIWKLHANKPKIFRIK